MLKNRTLLFVSSLLLWLFFALFPWHSVLADFDMLRVGLALILYAIPGSLTFLALSESKEVTLLSLLGGLTVSIFATGLLGVGARFFQLNFTFIRWMFALWGVGILVVYYLKNIVIIWKFERTTWWEALLLVVAAGCAIYFAGIASPPLIHDDAFTYNALLYYFQNAPALTFDFPDALNRLEIPRFWIAYWPLVEAMISSFSGVDGLFVTGSLLPPLLACLSFLSVYTLARTLGLSRLLAGAAVLAQGFSLLRLSRQNQPGNLFFQRLTEDKVVAAFILSMILLALVVQYFENPTRRKLLLIWIAAWAMAFTHPVQFGMTCMIAGVYGLPSLLNKDMRLKYVFIIGVLASVVVVPYLFRFGGGEYSQSLSFSLEDAVANDELERFGVRRVDIIEGTQFYGISRYLTVGLPYEISLVAVLVSLFFFWRSTPARYILSFFLVLGVSMLPYTGWIVGMFTTPFQLWRLTWLTPFGIAFAFLLWFGYELVQKVKLLNFLRSGLSPLYHASAYVGLVGLVIYVSAWAMSNVEKSNTDVDSFYANYVSAAAQMNALEVEGAPIILGGPDEATNSVIPSLTMKFEPMVFRVEIGSEKTRLWKTLMEDGTPPDVRFEGLKANDVEYLFLKGEPEWVVALANMYPENVTFLFRDERFSLYRIQY
ncbi:MAG: hypothetical protein JNK32_14005 [Anaerolineales bacterium]|nr:hypothetical protein [Anaerolineales bacterium]